MRDGTQAKLSFVVEVEKLADALERFPDIRTERRDQIDFDSFQVDAGSRMRKEAGLRRAIRKGLERGSP